MLEIFRDLLLFVLQQKGRIHNLCYSMRQGSKYGMALHCSFLSVAGRAVNMV